MRTAAFPTNGTTGAQPSAAPAISTSATGWQRMERLTFPSAPGVAVNALLASGLPVNPLTGTDNNGDTYAADRPVGLGRNSYRGPAQVQLDASLQKSFSVSERLRFDVRVEVFNLPNHANYITVNSTYGNTDV